jgi:protein-disulfide isomerase
MQNEQQYELPRPQGPQSRNLIPLAIIIAGALVAAAIYFGGGNTAGRSLTGGVQNQNAEIPKVTEKDHIIGSPSADVVVIEYSDTECPWCKVFHDTMHTLVDEYDGRVAWVYRHLPFHQKAPKEAQATECAAELGGNTAFWKYIDQVFEVTPSNDGLDAAQLPVIAQKIGLPVASFNDCLSSTRYMEDIQNGLKAAVKLGIQGTPYSVVRAKNGKETVINGAEPIENVRTKIDALLTN